MLSTTDTARRSWINPFRVDALSLAVFRIAIALVLLWDVIVRLWDLTAFYLPGGAVLAEVVRQSHQGSWSWSLNLWFDNTGWQLLLWGIRLVAALSLLVGFRSRSAAAVAWLLTISLHTATPMMVTGGDVLLAMMLFWSILLPIGGRLSLDARRGTGRRTAERVCSWATVGVILQLVIMYGFTAIAKCNATWFSGDALEVALADGALTRPVGQLMLLAPGLLRLLSWFTLVVEFGCPLLVLWPGQSRWPRVLGLLGLVGLHVGIELSMNVLIFSYSALAALILLSPGEWWKWLPETAPKEAAPLQAERAPLWESSLAIGCLSLVLVYNLLMLPVLQPLPDWARLIVRTVNAAHWNQRWDMFEDPQQLNYRFVLRGRLADGQTIDLARGSPLDAAVDPPRPKKPMQFATSRRILLFRELSRPSYIVFRPQLGHWLTDRWNAEHAKDERVLEMEWFYFVGPHQEGQAQAHLLAFVDTCATGAYRLGRRDGPWVLKDENGGKTAQGRYRLDQVEGFWIYWDGKGNRTAAGEFRSGLRQGPWTYYFDHGVQRTVYYKNDKQVTPGGNLGLDE